MYAKYTIEDIQKLAESYGGKCLSKTYDGTSKLLFECNAKHQWMTIAHNIRAGHWCPQCRNDKYKLPIEEIQELAKAHGGKCLSKTYKNNYAKLLFECSEKHQFWTRPDSVKLGSWCPSRRLLYGKMPQVREETHRLWLRERVGHR